LDSQSEHGIQSALAEVAGEKTVLIIAHRLSTIRHADCIYVIKDGKVDEAGTHDELVEQHGIYADLVHLQVNSDTALYI
jgi:ABC-type multidrug transport system fused ATPase/permease subunit